MKFTLSQLKAWFSQTINVLTGGYADEMISARIHRMTFHAPESEIAYWVRWENRINWLFRLFGEERHCRNAFQAEMKRKQMPSVYRGEVN